MPRITAAQLITQATAAAVGQGQARRPFDHERHRRMVAESSDAGAILLLGIARIDSCIEGFPGRVSVARSDGYLAGHALEKVDGKWGIADNVDNLWYQLATGSTRMQDAEALALRALGVPVAPASIASIDEVARWPDAAFLALDEALALLPDHTIRTLAANTTRVLQDMEMDPGQAPVLLRALWLQTELFPDFLPEAVEDSVPGVLTRAVTRNSPDIIRLMLDPAVMPTDSRPPEADAEITAALNAAVVFDGDCRLEMVKLLLDAGADPEWRGALNDTLLHRIVERAERRDPEQDAAVVELLLRHGVDPEHRDCHGRTAHDTLRSRMQEMDRDDLQPLLAVLDPHRQAPRPR